MSIVALHEAAHAVTARVLGVQVVHAIAAGDNPHVRTRFRRSRTREETINSLKRLVAVDLAGPVIEEDPNSEAAETDRCHAFARTKKVIALKDGVAVDELDDIQLADASALYQHLAKEAAALVKDSWPLIARLAHRLDELGEMSGAQVDVILLEAQI